MAVRHVVVMKEEDDGKSEGEEMDTGQGKARLGMPAVGTLIARQPFSLDALLLLLLVLPHRWWNPVSTALIILGVGIYLVLDRLYPLGTGPNSTPSNVTKRLTFALRLFIVILIIGIAAIVPSAYNIILRLTADPSSEAYSIAYSKTHDGAIQTEVAIGMILAGQNPYVEDYEDTLVANYVLPSVPVNPAIYHNAYLPFTFIFSIPFYVVLQEVVGWYDQRVVYLLTFTFLILLLPKLTRSQNGKLALLIAIGLNSSLVGSLAIGMNDSFVLFWLVLTVYLLQEGHSSASMVCMALACCTKHSAWLFLPFYFLYRVRGPLSLTKLKSAALDAWPLFVTLAVVVLPFFLWNPPAFIDDTYSYLVGTSAASYPIAGSGFGSVLLALGLIKSNTEYFPFWIPQLMFAVPVLICVLKKQLAENNLQQCWLGYGLSLLAVAFFSRFFQGNYFGFIVAILALAYFAEPGQPVPEGRSAADPQKSNE
jgi:hypothetical protein